MRKYNKKVTLKTVDDIFALVNDIANMPTGYFEAKPTRAVGLDEVEACCISYHHQSYDAFTDNSSEE